MVSRTLCGDPHVEADASPQDDGGKEGWNCLRMTEIRSGRCLTSLRSGHDFID